MIRSISLINYLFICINILYNCIHKFYDTPFSRLLEKL